MNFDEFNQTVFEQISNSYKKLTDTQTSTAAPVTTDSTPVSTDEPDQQGLEGDYEEEEFDHPDSPPPPSSVPTVNSRSL